MCLKIFTWPSIWVTSNLYVLALLSNLPLHRPKINAVVMRGLNDDEIVDLVELGRTKPLEIRYIYILKEIFFALLMFGIEIFFFHVALHCNPLV